MPLLLHKVLNLFIIWFSGMLLADVLLYKSFNIKAAILYLLLMLAGAFAGNFSIIGKEIILTVLIIILLYLMLTTSMFDYLKRFEKLGAFSYTLYAVHLPILCLISGFVMKANNGSLPAHFMYVPLAIVISLIAGWSLHFIGEKPFTKK
jgi:peptidoglycan/LPS O-acetylase OafA/YrhL